MAGRMTADVFEDKYGDLVRREFSQYTTAHRLQKVLAQRREPLNIPVGVLKLWLVKTGLPEGAVKVSSAEELQEKYGDVAQELAGKHSPPFTLCRAFKTCTPPVYVTDRVAKSWFRVFRGDLQFINSASHLELICGARIREQETTAGQEPGELQAWLRQNLRVEASVSTCQTWRVKDWSSSNKLLSIREVERDRLRSSFRVIDGGADGDPTEGNNE